MCGVLALLLGCLFFIMKRQMAHLMKVHEIGSIPFEMKTDTEGNLICDKAEVVSLR